MSLVGSIKGFAQIYHEREMTMDKATVIKALEICSSEKGCEACPYYGNGSCDKSLARDAIALLNAETKPQYHTAYCFSKVTNLLKWLQSNYKMFGTHGTDEQAQRIRNEYAREREVQLILLVRHEEGKCICRIKCPVNPLPLKGEFVVTNAADVGRLLIDLGWSFKDKLDLAMFR